MAAAPTNGGFPGYPPNLPPSLEPLMFEELPQYQLANFRDRPPQKVIFYPLFIQNDPCRLDPDQMDDHDADGIADRNFFAHDKQELNWFSPTDNLTLFQAAKNPATGTYSFFFGVFKSAYTIHNTIYLVPTDHNANLQWEIQLQCLQSYHDPAQVEQDFRNKMEIFNLFKTLPPTNSPSSTKQLFLTQTTPNLFPTYIKSEFVYLLEHSAKNIESAKFNLMGGRTHIGPTFKDLPLTPQGCLDLTQFTKVKGELRSYHADFFQRSPFHIIKDHKIEMQQIRNNAALAPKLFSDLLTITELFNTTNPEDHILYSNLNLAYSNTDKFLSIPITPDNLHHGTIHPFQDIPLNEHVDQYNRNRFTYFKMFHTFIHYLLPEVVYNPPVDYNGWIRKLLEEYFYVYKLLDEYKANHFPTQEDYLKRIDYLFDLIFLNPDTFYVPPNDKDPNYAIFKHGSTKMFNTPQTLARFYGFHFDAIEIEHESKPPNFLLKFAFSNRKQNETQHYLLSEFEGSLQQKVLHDFMHNVTKHTTHYKNLRLLFRKIYESPEATPYTINYDEIRTILNNFWGNAIPEGTIPIFKESAVQDNFNNHLQITQIYNDNKDKFTHPETLFCFQFATFGMARLMGKDRRFP